MTSLYLTIAHSVAFVDEIKEEFAKSTAFSEKGTLKFVRSEIKDTGSCIRVALLYEGADGFKFDVKWHERAMGGLTDMLKRHEDIHSCDFYSGPKSFVPIDPSEKDKALLTREANNWTLHVDLKECDDEESKKRRRVTRSVKKV